MLTPPPSPPPLTSRIVIPFHFNPLPPPSLLIPAASFHSVASHPPSHSFGCQCRFTPLSPHPPSPQVKAIERMIEINITTPNDNSRQQQGGDDEEGRRNVVHRNPIAYGWEKMKSSRTRFLKGTLSQSSRYLI